MTDATDSALARAAIAGDPDAFATLALRHADKCWKAAFALTLSRTAADDAVQEAMARALRAMRRFDPSRPFAPWLKRIAVNCALDELRARSRLVVSGGGGHGDMAAPRRDDQLGPVWDALAALSAEQRVPIAMHHVLGYPYAEIATILDLPPGTVASRVARGLERLRRTLEATHAH